MTLVRTMIGEADGTVDTAHLAERARRLVSLICALAFLIAGIAHVDHAAATAKSTTAYFTTIDTDDGGDESSKSERLVAKACHCGALAALPAAVGQTDPVHDATVLPIWVAGRMNVRSPGAELPPPRIPA